MPRSTINGTAIDLDGKEMILDADQDTTITVDTDDQIDFKIAGTDTVHIISSGIGIGTASISSGFKLEVLGDVRFGDAYNDDAVELGWSSGASKGFVQAYDRGASSFRNLNLNNAVEIDSSGNVGIGTSSPATDFHVAGASYSAPTNGLDSNINLLINNTQYAGLGLLGANNGSSFIHFGDGDDMDVGQINYVHADNVMTFTTNTSEAMRIDSSGNVGIGETSPANLLHVKASDVSAAPIDTALMVLEKSGTNFLSFMGANTNVQGVLFGDADDNDVGQIVYNHSSDIMDFKCNGSERMRIDSSGHVSIGTTSTGGNSALTMNANAFSGGIKIFGGNGQVIQSFEVAGNIVGRIEVNNAATIYSTSSDYRLKENVVTDWDATTRLKKLKPSRFNFKVDKDTTVDGFLAHEVSSIVPEAITGEKDAVDKDGNPEYQGIDQSKLVPLLTKALQESMARADALEARIKKLEGS